MQEYELKEIEKLKEEVRSLHRSMFRSRIIEFFFSVCALLFTLLYTIERYHLSIRESFSRTYGPTVTTIAVCGQDKIPLFRIEKGSILGLFRVYFIVDIATGKQYPITMCEPRLEVQKAAM